MKYLKEAIERRTAVDKIVDAADRLRKNAGPYNSSRPLAEFAKRLRQAQTSYPPNSPEAAFLGEAARGHEVASRIAPVRKPRTTMKRKTGQGKVIDIVVKLAERTRIRHPGTSSSMLIEQAESLEEASRLTKNPTTASELRTLGQICRLAARIPRHSLVIRIRRER